MTNLLKEQINAATYTDIFTLIRRLFANLPIVKKWNMDRRDIYQAFKNNDGMLRTSELN